MHPTIDVLVHLVFLTHHGLRVCNQYENGLQVMVAVTHPFHVTCWLVIIIKKVKIPAETYSLILNMLLKQPIPSYPATQRHWTRCWVRKGCSTCLVWSSPLPTTRLLSLTHRRIYGDLISMCKITDGHLEFPMENTFTQPTRKGLRSHASKFKQ